MKDDFKQLIYLLKPYKARMTLVISLGIIIAIFKSSIPYLMKQLTEKAWVNEDRELAIYIPLTIAGVWIIVNILRYVHMYWMKYIAESICMNLRRQLMVKYLNLNLSYLNKFVRGSGGLISRMINDINSVQLGIEKLSDLVREPFTALFTFAYLLYIDWVLVVFLIVTIPIVSIIIKNLSKSLQKYGHQSMQTMEDLTKTMKESLDGTRIVQSFNLQDFMQSKFSSQADKYLKSRSKIISREQTAGPASEILTSIALSGILIYIGSQIFEKKLTVADFLVFSFALAMIGDSVKKMQAGIVGLQQSFVALKRYNEIVSDGEQVPDTENPVAFNKDWQNINFKNVSFSYGDKPILKDINLTIKRGEVVALVGSSGGGKSTLVNLLGRFFEPNKGNILFDDVCISDFSLNDYRDHVALVSQDVFLFSDSIKNNIQSGKFSAQQEEIVAAAKMANAHDFIMNTPEGYDSLCGERGAMLSGGEKQRISIARAILKDAPVLILDEATSALDNESEKEVQKGLKALMQGRTTFVIAHRLSTIENADRILVIKEGEIVEQGSHSQLMNMHGEYTRLQTI